MKVITIANRKGGVGKTTSVWAIGHTLAQSGAKVLFIDCDPQCNLTMAMPRVTSEQHLGQVLTGGQALGKAVAQIGPNSYLVQATDALTAVEKMLGTDMDYPFALRNALATLGMDMDYVIFDTSPSPHSPLAIAAMVASDALFIPVHPAYFAYEGLASLLDVVRRIQRNYNPRLKVGGLFLTSYAKSYRDDYETNLSIFYMVILKWGRYSWNRLFEKMVLSRKLNSNERTYMIMHLVVMPVKIMKR